MASLQTRLGCLPSVQVELVGARVPLSALTMRYQQHAPMLAAVLLSLESEFPACRSIAGDGNCFYRGFLFGLVEALLSSADLALHNRYEAFLAAKMQVRQSPISACSLACISCGVGRTWLFPAIYPRGHASWLLRFGAATKLENVHAVALLHLSSSMTFEHCCFFLIRRKHFYFQVPSLLLPINH